MIPPPSASLVTGPSAALFVTRTFTSVVVPKLSTPPPLACAKGHVLPHGSVDGMLLAGAA
jgi:hypothetical protein